MASSLRNYIGEKEGKFFDPNFGKYYDIATHSGSYVNQATGERKMGGGPAPYGANTPQQVEYEAKINSGSLNQSPANLRSFITQTPSNPQTDHNMSPEANAAVNRGNPFGGSPAGSPPPTPNINANAPKDGAPPPTYAANPPPPESNHQTGMPPPATTTPVDTSKYALPLMGKSIYDQAEMLTKFLQDNGVVNIPRFAVGGSSAYDKDINSLIDRINQPNVSDGEKRMMAQQLSQIISLRTNSMTTPATFQYDAGAEDGQRIIGPPGAPGTRTTNDMIGDLSLPPGGTIHDNQSSPLRGQLNDLLAEFTNGGVANPEQMGLQQSQLISSLEHGAGNRRQQIADQLASSGISGGRADATLRDLDAENAYSRSMGLSNLHLGQLDRQSAAKERALMSMLSLAGMDSEDARAMAGLLSQRQIAQAQLGIDDEQFNRNMEFQGDLNTSNLNMRGQESQMLMIMDLLRLAASGDEAQAARAWDMLMKLGLG